MSEDNFLQRWKITKQRGAWRYLLRIGLLWGLFMTIAMNVFEGLSYSFQQAFLSKYFVFDLIFWCVSGVIFFAGALWLINNFIYKQRLKKMNLKKEDI